jgi:hypothetical protein
MTTRALGDAEFLLGYCPACQKDVLTYFDLELHDHEIRRCLHCDRVITDEIRPMSGADLEASGYTVLGARSCGNGGACGMGAGCSFGSAGATRLPPGRHGAS